MPPINTPLHPTRQLLVRDALSAAESVLPSSACAAIYGVMSHVHISNTPSSTNVIVELDGLLQASHSPGRILSAGGHESVTVKRTIVQFSFERLFDI